MAPLPESDRLIIKQIICENFKSYGGKKILGPFHHLFSAIIGPNGSGKSNVIDAILFVFGFRSSKIRSKKLSALIHESDSIKSVTSCSVTVFFERIYDDAKEVPQVIANNEFSIKRTAYNDSSSDYFINDKKFPVSSIIQLLKDNGVDLDHNRFLILQGEVENIALMKKKATNENEVGFLEYLEDIIGTNKYIQNITDYQQEIDNLNTKRTEQFTKVSFLEKERNILESQQKEVRNFVDLENSIQLKKHQINALKIQRLKESNEQIYISSKRTSEQINAISLQIKEKNSQKRNILAQKNTLKKNNENFISQYNLEKDKISELEKLLIKNNENSFHLEDEKKELVSNFTKDTEKYKSSLKDKERLEKELAKYTASKIKLEEEKSSEEKVVNELIAIVNQKTKSEVAELEIKEIAFMEKDKLVKEAYTKYQVAVDKLEILNKSSLNKENQLKQITEKLSSLTDDISAKKIKIKSTEESVIQLNKLIDHDQKILDTKKKEIDDLKTELKQKRSVIESELNYNASTKNKNNLLASLKNEQNKGLKLKGMIDRLGDLASVDQKYDIAISTCCPSLDNILVNLMDDAIECVEFLRKNNLGTSSFIALEKMSCWIEQCSKNFEKPNNSRRLFDLIKIFDDKFKPAFYFALRDTLVVDDVDLATKVAYKGSLRHRVVTLTGELMEKQGTISGGGKSNIRGRMLLNDNRKDFVDKTKHQLTAEQLKSFEEECSFLLKKIDALFHEITDLEKILEQNRKNLLNYQNELKNLKTEEEKLNLSIKQRQQDLKQLNSKKDEEFEDKSSQIDYLKKDIVLLEKKHKEVLADSEKIALEIDELKKRIRNISNGIFGDTKNRLDTTDKLLDETITMISKCLANQESVERTRIRYEEMSSEYNRKICQLETDINNFSVDLVKLKSELTEHQNIFKCLRLEMETISNQNQIFENEIEYIDKDICQWENQLRTLNDEKDDISSKICNVEQKINTILTESNKLVETYFDSTGQHFEKPIESSEFNLTSLDSNFLQSEIATLSSELENLKQPNYELVSEYCSKVNSYMSKVQQLELITSERDQLIKKIDDLKSKRLYEFFVGFSEINLKLKEMYQAITLGGDAELEYVDTLDPFADGIVFSVRPPNKSWKNISNLSGGEKTLSSLALVFSLHHYRPSPFYIMDEIDAALDFKNVSIVAKYIKDKAKNAQFIVISLRNNMFELADRLIGIYKTDSITKSVALNPFRMLSIFPISKQCNEADFCVLKENNENRSNWIDQ